MAPGSMQALRQARRSRRGQQHEQELLERGVEPVRELSVITEADGGTFFGFQDPDGNSWAVQEIKARALKPLIPKDHAGLSEWAGRAG